MGKQKAPVVPRMPETGMCTGQSDSQPKAHPSQQTCWLRAASVKGGCGETSLGGGHRPAPQMVASNITSVPREGGTSEGSSVRQADVQGESHSQSF